MKNYIFLSLVFVSMCCVCLQPPQKENREKMTLGRQSKPLAQFMEIGNLINSLDAKALEDYLSSHDLREITTKAQEQFLAPLIASFSYFKTDKDRKKYAQIIQVLIKHRFKPGKAQLLYERNRSEIEKITQE